MGIREFFGRLFGRGKKPVSGPRLSGVAAFVAGERLVCSSSNVAAATYYPGRRVMTVEFLNGSAYTYAPVDDSMAASFAAAGSKGSWIWTHFRVRGPGGDAKAAPGITVHRIN